MSLLAAVALLFFSTGRWIIPVAAWLSPVFLLRFVRSHRAFPGLVVATLASIGVQFVVWRGMIPAPGALYYAIVTVIAITGMLPYLADRLIGPRVGGFKSTLVFPCAWAAVEYLSAAMSPYGTWGVTAYSQADDLPLIQMVSVTGLWGIGFLVAWLASVANCAWEEGFEWRKIRGGVLAYGAVLALVHLMGGALLALAPPSSDTVRVASFTHTPRGLDPWNLLGHRVQGAALDSVRAQLRAHQDTLLEWSRREARAGAMV